ncbi:hypothetical protein ALC57_13215 [Trachymyrmex cornetzi]|uniref:Uncharacterized protein n=1 Tax=Trachymyrmex cornetzi TaxID=471704 RepID=A0A151IZU6_9HYME|nr:hypothetical protein ALC57_13215 [Trachymyrmex cornetzi]
MLFTNRKQKFGENIAAFGLDIERLARLAYPECSDLMRDKIACAQFLLVLCTCLYIKPTTMLFLFDLKQCVEFYELSQYTHSEKFKYFVSFLRENCITNKRDAANILYRIYVKNSAIVC